MSAAVPESITAINAEKTTLSVRINKKPNGQLNELGRGANGVVYKGSHNSLGKTIAVKRFLLHPTRDQGAYINMVLKTAKSVESSYFLSSVFTKCNPAFICFYGLVIHRNQEKAFTKHMSFEQVKRQAVFISDEINEDTFYLLFEYVNGNDLDSIISKSTGDINYRKYGLALLKALVHLRNVVIKVRANSDKTIVAQMVHLDIKPSNMMIETHTDTLKIIDLNTICIPVETKDNGGCKRQSMTFEYSGPESIVTAADPKEQRKSLLASDIFATGLTLYEMIMKRRGLELEEHSITAWLDYWDKKIPAGAELDLVFTPDKMKWATLIRRMTKRDYKERPNAKTALAEFQNILDWEDGPHYGASQEAGFRKTRKRKNAYKRRKNSRKL
jgi:hypothetical protein